MQADELERYLKWLCTTPKTTTMRVNTLKSNPNEIRRYINEHLIDTVPNPFVMNFAANPDVLLIENGFESLTTEQCDDCKEIVIDTNCGAAVLRGAHIFAPGVLAMQSNTKFNELVNVYADIDGACKKGTNTVYQSARKLFVGVGRVKMQRYQLYGNDACMSGIAVEMVNTVSGVPSIGDSFIPAGKAILQNLPSIICSLVLNPRPNDIVLDMCAAPGNKTTHLAQMMQNLGTIIALDKSEHRVSVLRKNIRDFDAKCVQAIIFDATKCLANDTQSTIDGNDRLQPPFSRNRFDKILLDAPCSGFGNRPLLANSMTPKMQKSYPVMQKKLLDVAVELLKPGGTLVYSTCTIFCSENEANVKWILNRYEGNLDLVAAEPFHGGPGWSNVGLTEDERRLVQRFGPDVDPLRLPSHHILNDTVAFFIAKFLKK